MVEADHTHLNDDVDQQFDATIVLGGGLDAITIARVTKGVEILKSYLCRKLVLVGSDEEVEFMRRKASELGVDESALLCQGGSRNTIDNAYYAKRVLKRLGARRVALVTSEFHMERALAIFEWVLGEGYEITPVPTKDSPSEEVLEREEVFKALIPFLKLFKKGDEENIKRWADEFHGLLRALEIA
jgi:uncharacterized SAM-binding protein YcdF (DUF218 family)